MKIFTIIGARPQFIKASVVSRELFKTPGVEEVLLHTGQHFDANMSEVFFEQLNIPYPKIRLNVNGGSHGDMTGRMLAEIESVLIQEKPDRVMVYGDTNSTLAGALAAAKLNVPVAHIEAGLRSHNMSMPEEINRILTDQLSDQLYCPTQTAVENLLEEGFDKKPVKINNVGDVMQDAALLFSDMSSAPKGFNHSDEFVLATLHRAENTDNLNRLKSIVNALNGIHKEIAPVILPLHPRTKDAIERGGLSLDVCTLNPVGYFEMLWLLKRCGIVLTDSGGVQKEASFFGKSCVTMRDETEWTELVEIGANVLTGASKDLILENVRARFGSIIKSCGHLYGGGEAAGRIVSLLTGR